jgi:pilus assembly protein CpaE
MIAEVAANNRVNDIYRQVGMVVTGRTNVETASKAAGLKLPGFLAKRKRA